MYMYMYMYIYMYIYVYIYHDIYIYVYIDEWSQQPRCAPVFFHTGDTGASALFYTQFCGVGGHSDGTGNSVGV